MTLPTDAPLPTHTPEPRFDFDLFCNNCRYNLRGLTPDSRCPECGTPIAAALLEDPLHFADPAWLDRLRRGAALLVWPIPIFIASIIIAAAATTIGADILLLLATLLFVRGAWQLTSRDPQRPTRDARPRRITRAALLLLLIATPLSLLPLPTLLDVVLFILVILLAAVATYGLLHRCTDLARRLQRSILHNVAALLAVASIPAALTIAAIVTLSTLYPHPIHTTFSQIAASILIVILLVFLPTLLFAYPLFFHTLRKRLAAAQVYAASCQPAAPISSPVAPVDHHPN
jgi:hypothetical protein